MRPEPPLGIVIRQNLKVALDSAIEVATWAIERKIHVFVEEMFQKAFQKKGLTQDNIRFASLEIIAESCSPIVTLGGDGTLIGVARFVDQIRNSPTFIGVNFGQLGFLTEVSPPELFQTLEEFYRGETKIVTRKMLKAYIIQGANSTERQSVNDLVIQRGAKDPLLDLDVLINEEFLMHLRADGLILSTPTGSTAYSLAAGGSIALPQVPVTLLTPLCPHSLTIRPLILPCESKISIIISKHRGTVHAIFDGQESHELKERDKVVVTQSNNTVHFVRSPHYSYFEILQRKLNWGKMNGAPSS